MKRVLIIDDLSSCDNCPCYDGMDGRCECTVTFKDLEDTDTIDKDCPLKPLPEIKIEKLEYLRRLGASIRELECYVMGHDDCIEEILGEENE